MKFKLKTKQFFTFFIVMSMVFAMMIPAYAEDNVTSTLAKLPEVGEKISGFLTVERDKINIVGANTVYFEHEKSGAKLLYIQTEDKNRSFSINFRTPAKDQKGIPHVFEHISISGSKEYPAQNIFFPIINKMYTTFINAHTMPNYTSYPIASLSEKQLLVLSDYYMGGVFEPLLLTEKRLYNREAWRYELESKDAPITITGTVYNEMKGNENIANAAYFNTLDALFPNSIMRNNSGGNPDFITDMTYEDLIKFHDTYYHPSNALIILYGNLDYKNFLKQYDEKFLSKYDKKDINIETGIISPLTEERDLTYNFPVEKGAVSEKASYIDYAFALNDISEEESIALGLVTSVLNLNSSVFMKKMNETFPGTQALSEVVAQHNTPFLLFQANGLNETDKPAFKKVVDDTLNDILKNGMDKKIVDTVVSSIQFSSLLISEKADLGVNLSSSIAATWAVDDKISNMDKELEMIKAVVKKIDSGFLQQVCEKYLVNNKHRVLVATVPKPGLVEEKNAALETKLAEKKALMTDDEIKKMIEDTEKLKKWSREEPPKELIDKLKVITSKNLPTEVKAYSVSRTEKNGGIYMTAEANVGNIGMTDILLDSSSIAPEDLQYYALYASLLGQLDTENYSNDELLTSTMRYLNGFYITPTFIEDSEKQYNPVLRVNWCGLMDEYDENLDLVYEILFNTDFSDVNSIKNKVSQMVVNMKQAINTNAYNFQIMRTYGQQSDVYKYLSNISGFEYFEFLQAVEKELESNPQIVLDKLNAIALQLKSGTGIKVFYSGNKDGIKKFNNTIDKFTEKLDKKDVKKADYSSLPSSKGREAIVIDSAVSYNMLCDSAKNLEGYKYSGKIPPISKYIYDAYLTPKIRHEIGAYDTIISFDENGLALISYRDPSIVETNKIYDDLDEFVLNSKITDEQLEDYIISSYGDYTKPKGELLGASNYLYMVYSGKSVKDKEKFLQEMKSLKFKDVKEFASILKKLVDEGVRSTSGGAAVIEKNKELFDSVYMPLGDTNSPDANKPLTRGELVSLLFGGVEGALDKAKAMGIIKGDGLGNYRENENVTKEEFAVLLTRALQGLPKGSSEGITDFDSLEDWSEDAVATVVTLKLFALDENGAFNPQSTVTMSDIMTIMTILQSM